MIKSSVFFLFRTAGFVLGLLVALLLPLQGTTTSFAPYEEQMTAAEEESVLRILVMGCDAKAGLTDSIFILAIKEECGDVGILQIPRDTYAAYTDRDYRKLNGAWKTLGPLQIRGFYSEALGVPIDGFVVLNLSDLRRIVDAVGGVDIEIPESMDYSDPAQDLEIHFTAGHAHLDGRAAEKFVRYRSGYANADLGRLDAQKLFMQAFARRLRQIGAGRASCVLAASLTAVQTDLSLPKLVRAAAALERSSVQEVAIATIPGQAVQGNSGAWYYSLNREGAIRAIEDYLFVKASAARGRFDPKEIFDRKEHPSFHKIYIAPLGELPTE